MSDNQSNAAMFDLLSQANALRAALSAFGHKYYAAVAEQLPAASNAFLEETASDEAFGRIKDSVAVDAADLLRKLFAAQDDDNLYPVIAAATDSAQRVSGMVDTMLG